MKLEDEIKQLRFESEIQKAVLNIKFTANWLSSMVNTTLKPYHISQEQYNVLRILRGQHPKTSTMGLISERMIDRMSNATRLVEKLKNTGLVTREVCATNRRKVDILITKKGLDLLKKLDPVISDMFSKHNVLPEKELKELNDILDRLRD